VPLDQELDRRVRRVLEEFRVQRRNQALAMGMHERLGAGSVLHCIREEILRLLAGMSE